MKWPRWSTLKARTAALLPDVAVRAMVAALCLAVIGLVGLSYRSIREWRRSSEMLSEQRAQMALALLTSVINRDMRGVQVAVLLPTELDDVLREPPYDMRDAFARAFSRFQYPESFLVWTRTAPSDERLYAFDRTDRVLPWHTSSQLPEAYPAAAREHPEDLRPLIHALRRHAVPGVRFVVLEDELRGIPYQIVAKVFTDTSSGETVGIVGFTVNLDWARKVYFPQLAREVSRIGDVADSVALAVEDENGGLVALTVPELPNGPDHRREFTPVFFEPAMLSTLAAGTPTMRPWTARVMAAGDPMLAAASRGAGVTYIILTAAALASVAAMLFTARVVRARAQLAAMQTDFVCTMTHELKTPLAFIRLLGETLGRYDSQAKIHDYARLLSQEAWRLTRLVENILAFARVSDATGRHQFEPVEVSELVEDALAHFRPQLGAEGFAVTVDIPTDLAPIRGDRTRLLQALDNLLDNAIKYSGEQRALIVRATGTGESVQLDVSDRGMGIPAEELVHVFDRFFRGRTTQASGSGLGLAIVKRVVDEHHGEVEIRSVPGEGTSVRVILPVGA